MYFCVNDQVKSTFPHTPEAPDSSRGIEDDLSSVHTIHKPVEGMMAPIADVHSYLSKLSLEHCMASVALHVICGLSESGKMYILLYISIYICIYTMTQTLQRINELI